MDRHGSENNSSPDHKNMPNYIDTILYDPKKDYSGLYVIANRNLAKPVSLDALTKTFAEKSIPFQVIIEKTTDSSISFYAILDFTGKSQSRGTLEKEIRSLFGENLVYLEYSIATIPGLVCNVKGFPLLLEVLGTPFQVTGFTHPFLSNMFRAIYETFGAGGLSILWLSGRESIESMRSIRSLPLDKSHKMSLAMIQLQLLGWGKFELIELGDKNCTLRMYENFECIATSSLKGYQSSFMRGVFAGLASLLFDKKGNCVEKKCIRKGDPYCEFSLE